MHWIQQHVIKKLIRNKSLRYADIKPKEVEGSLFMYHLRRLIKEDLVQKQDKLYSLTPSGRLMADKLKAESLIERQQPRVLVLVACRDKQKGLVLLRRRVHPVIDMVGFPALDMALGRKLIDHAEEAFREETGLSLDLKRKGDGYITLRRKGIAESYIFFHLLEGWSPRGDLISQHETGELYWEDKPLENDDLIPSMPKLLDLLDSSSDGFFVELDYKL